MVGKSQVGRSEARRLGSSPVYVHVYAQVAHGEGMELGFTAKGESHRVSEIKGELRGVKLVSPTPAEVLQFDDDSAWRGRGT